MGGWVEPVKLGADRADMIRAELSRRRDRVFRDSARQEAFLCRVEGVLTYLATDRPASDPHGAQDRLADCGRALAQMQRAFGRLRRAEVGAVEHGTRGTVAALMAEVAAMEARLARAVEAVRMPPGAHDARPGGAVRVMVAQLADAWGRIFAKPASPDPGGAFFAVANIVLGQAGLPSIGKDALRTILKPAG